MDIGLYESINTIFSYETTNETYYIVTQIKILFHLVFMKIYYLLIKIPRYIRDKLDKCISI